MRCSNTYNDQKQSTQPLWTHGAMLQRIPISHKKVLVVHTHGSIGNGKFLEQSPQLINSHSMHVQPISWEYIGEEKCLWLGKTNGLLSHIKIYIIPKEKVSDEYLISANINGFVTHTTWGIEKTKAKAQDLLNSYAISLIL